MSIGKVVKEQAEKMKDGIHHIEVSASEDGKHFIAEHHHHDYEHPHHMDQHVLRSRHELGRHLAKHLKCCAEGMGGKSDKNEEDAKGEEEE